MTDTPDYSRPLTRQEQEALSVRYARCAVVVPLQDGSFGVFANDRAGESLVIVDHPEDLHLAVLSRANMSNRKTPSKVPGASVRVGGLFEEDEEGDTA